MRWVLTVFFLALALYPADINSTLINGDVKTYESLLATLKQSKNHSDATALQEALLYKLINISKSSAPQLPKLPPPKNEKKYRQLVLQLLKWTQNKANSTQSLEDLQEKIATLEDQIHSFAENNTTSSLTLQLQYAFYTKAKNLLNRQLQTYDALLSQAPELFVHALHTITLDSKTSAKNLKQIERDLQKIQKDIQKIEIEKERLKLLGKNDRVQALTQRILSLQQKQKDLLQQKILELFIQWSAALQKKDSKQIFALHHQIVDTANKVYPPDALTDLSTILSSIENKILGRAAVLKGATLEQIKITLHKIWTKANMPLFSINDTPISAFKIFVAFVILMIGFFIGMLYKKGIKKLSERSRTITPSTRTLLGNLGYYFIVIVALFLTLKTLGIDLSSITLIAGALSVGIGFGLQNMVSNFVSGLILMFERSVKIGDYVEIDDNLTGHITDIKMRSTTITTNDNIDVIVPNQDLIQNRVINWTMNDKIRRFRIPFGVAYGTDAQKVIKIIKEAVANSGFRDIYQDKERITRVIMTEMGDSSVNFELFVWIKGQEILYPKRTTSRFLVLIYETLYKHGIEIPFPQRDLHIRSIDTPIPISLHTKDQKNSKE